MKEKEKENFLQLIMVEMISGNNLGKKCGCPGRLIIVVIIVSNHAAWAGVPVELPLAPRLAASSGDWNGSV